MNGLISDVSPPTSELHLHRFLILSRSGFRVSPMRHLLIFLNSGSIREANANTIQALGCYSDVSV
jgi:hypothetical protein